MFIKSDVKSEDNSTAPLTTKKKKKREKDSELQTLFPFIFETQDWSEEKPSLTSDNYSWKRIHKTFIFSPIM